MLLFFLPHLFLLAFPTFSLNRFSSSCRSHFKIFFRGDLLLVNFPFSLSEGVFFSLLFARYTIKSQNIFSKTFKYVISFSSGFLFFFILRSWLSVVTLQLVCLSFLDAFNIICLGSSI